MTPKENTNTYRTTARVVGVVYLAGFVVGLVGEGLFQSILGASNYLSIVSANSMTVAIGAMVCALAALITWAIVRSRNTEENERSH